MLGEGAVDVILSKPVSRFRIFLGKLGGGVALFAGVLLAFYAILYIGLGLRLGIWHARAFMVVPLQVFSALTLYSLVALIGIVSRSSTLSMVLGYFFYFVIDTAITVFGAIRLGGALEDYQWAETLIDNVLRYVPNFGFINDTAVSSVYDWPEMNLGPLWVALWWVLGSCALGYWKFHKTDY